MGVVENTILCRWGGKRQQWERECVCICLCFTLHVTACINYQNVLSTCIKLLRNKINKWINQDVGGNVIGNKKGFQRKRNEDRRSQKALHDCEVVKELRKQTTTATKNEEGRGKEGKSWSRTWIFSEWIKTLFKIISTVHLYLLIN